MCLASRRSTKRAAATSMSGALAVQALVLASVSFLVGGLLAGQVVRLIAAALVPPTLAKPEIGVLIGGPFDIGLGVAGVRRKDLVR